MSGDDRGGSGAKLPVVLETVFFEDRAIRATPRSADGVVWYVVADLKGLACANPTRAVRDLDEDERGLTLSKTPHGSQELVVVNESGLYALALRANGAMRKGTVQHRFRRWVTSELLPKVRERGFYAAPGSVLASIADDPGLSPLLEAIAEVSNGDLSPYGGIKGFSQAVFEARDLLDSSRRGAVHDRTDGMVLMANGEMMCGPVSTGICSICAMVACRAASFRPSGLTGPRLPVTERGPSVVATAVRLVEEALASGLSVVLWIEDFEPEDRLSIRARVGGRFGVTMVLGPSSTRLPEDLHDLDAFRSSR